MVDCTRSITWRGMTHFRTQKFSWITITISIPYLRHWEFSVQLASFTHHTFNLATAQPTKGHSFSHSPQNCLSLPLIPTIALTLPLRTLKEHTESRHTETEDSTKVLGNSIANHDRALTTIATTFFQLFIPKMKSRSSILLSPHPRGVEVPTWRTTTLTRHSHPTQGRQIKRKHTNSSDLGDGRRLISTTTTTTNTNGRACLLFLGLWSRKMYRASPCDFADPSPVNPKSDSGLLCHFHDPFGTEFSLARFYSIFPLCFVFFFFFWLFFEWQFVTIFPLYIFTVSLAVNIFS